jgi:hypothetical protein
MRHWLVIALLWIAHKLEPDFLDFLAQKGGGSNEP